MVFRLVRSFYDSNNDINTKNGNSKGTVPSFPFDFAKKVNETEGLKREGEEQKRQFESLSLDYLTYI
jgi:hypothetical protein